MKMKNEIALIDKIDKRLKEKNPISVFPLSPTHRKELRELRDTNIGGLHDRIRNIRKLKKEEYKQKYAKDIYRELESQQVECDSLNANWIEIIEKVNKLLSDRKKHEEKISIDKFNRETGYGTFCSLDELDDDKREFSVDIKSTTNNIVDTEFNNKYGKAFDGVTKQIDDIHTKYEEAINFGDLELVKELYYIMKQSESLFDKIAELKI